MNKTVESRIQTYRTGYAQPTIFLRLATVILISLAAVGILVRTINAEQSGSFPTTSLYGNGVETANNIAWTDAISGLTDLNCRTLAMNPVTTSMLYIATQRGDFRSLDSGENWESIRDYTIAWYRPQFAIDVTNPLTVYLADGEILKSTNNGTSWTTISDDLPSRYYPLAIAVSPISPSLLFVGTSQSPWGGYKSSDGGVHWEEISDLPNNGIERFVFEPGNPDRAYAATWDGVYISTDSGGSWHPSNNGIGPNDAIYDIAISPTSPTIVYIANDYGIYRSLDRGGNWIKVYSTGVRGHWYIEVDPLEPGTVYASCYYEIIVTYDYGAHWSQLLSPPSTLELVLDRRSDNQGWLYVCGWDYGIKKGALLLSQAYLPLVAR